MTMTRFEESALRNSAAAESNPSTLPYWHPSSQFSSLIDPQHDAAVHQANGQHAQPIQYQQFTDDQMSMSSQQTSLGFDVPSSYRSMDYTQFNDFSQVSHEISQQLSRPDQRSIPGMPPFNQGMRVKTPTSSRSMRRPGLAGASALVNGQYSCQWTVNGVACRHKFIDAKQLNDHIRSYHVRGAGDFVCQWSGCDKGSFPTANKLVRHVHSHTGYKPFPCPNCSQAFVTKDQLDKHLTTHTGAKDFVCTWPSCGRSFAVKHALDGHMNSVHFKAKKHICPHCAQAFDDSSNLSKHKKQVHNVETGIKCPARHTHCCTYVDSRKDKMKEHCERECHGLETISDPHAWNLWVQQFKSGSRKSESRRQSREMMSGSPVSRMSSMSTPPFVATPRRAPSIECSKQGCNIPVCLPCNILCNDVHPGHDDLQPCEEPGCDPCDPCDDPDCDPLTRQRCNIPPCNIPHCRSGTSTPSHPATPHGIPLDSYFQYHPVSAPEGDIFQDAELPFQLSSARLADYTFMNG